METRQLGAELFHEPNLRFARFLFRPRCRELHRERPRRRLAGVCHLRLALSVGVGTFSQG